MFNKYCKKRSDNGYAAAGYKSGGRGYPDIALAASRYSIFLGGAQVVISGTSASTPVMAAFVSLVNAFRHSNGLGPLGFINEGIIINNCSFFRSHIVVVLY